MLWNLAINPPPLTRYESTLLAVLLLTAFRHCTVQPGPALPAVLRACQGFLPIRPFLLPPRRLDSFSPVTPQAVSKQHCLVLASTYEACGVA